MPSAVNVVIAPLAHALTYLVPSVLEGRALFGCRVEVPLGRRSAMGFVVEEQVAPTSKGFALKELKSSHEPQLCFSRDQFKFFQWVAEYYGEVLSNVIETAIPPTTPLRTTKHVQLLHDDTTKLRGSLQKTLIDVLKDEGGACDLTTLHRRFKGSRVALKKLSTLGLIEITESESFRWYASSLPEAPWAKRVVSLTAEQNEAVRQISNAIERKEFAPFLLHGVTGSGKTEVYLEVVERVLARGQGALIMVPEIALTPQLVDRFRARLGNEIAVLHSALQRRTRWDSWRALLEKRTLVALGARSAVFAPLDDIGVIVVDEEHDPSYKQSDGLRYQARDLAVLRAKFHRCPVILGSATPALESWTHAARGKYTKLSLLHRPYETASATYEVVNLGTIKPWDMRTPHITPLLHEALSATIARREQAFILYNRRGFASYLQCEICEAVLGCPNCSVTLTFHQRTHALLCHYCGLQVVPPAFCPRCVQKHLQIRGSAQKVSAGGGEEVSQEEELIHNLVAPYLIGFEDEAALPPCLPRTPEVLGALAQRGAGTERVFDELKGLFPFTHIERLDRDAAADLESYRGILDRMRHGVIQVLVGTQMIAKGHDLPNVTLVGVVDCDIGLHMPDFRAGERVFHLLTQAGGRAGRAEKPGRVILQTRVPQSPSVFHTAEANYAAFAAHEMAARKALHYPPFCRMLRIVASAAEKELPRPLLQKFRAALLKFKGKLNLELDLLGPAPAPLARLKNVWRWHLLLKASKATNLVRAMNYLRQDEFAHSKVKVTFDMDPQDML